MDQAVRVAALQGSRMAMAEIDSLAGLFFRKAVKTGSGMSLRDT
jgi:hypothetical protein